jgi:hypothetical protein
MLDVLTPARSRKETVQTIFDHYRDEGREVSWSRAKRIADQISKGTFSPDPRLARAIEYADPTGNRAATNVDRERQRPQCIAAKQEHQGPITDS